MGSNRTTPDEPSRRDRHRERERTLAALAGSQRGVVSLAQLRELGFDESFIKRRLGRSLFELAPAVYAVGHTGISRRGRGIAALLQAGPDAALSHDSAARVWGLVDHEGDGPIHVSVRNRSRLAVPDGIVLHRPRTLRDGEIVAHRGLRVTTPERTVIDHLDGSTTAEITRMLEQMVTRLHRSPDDLHVWAQGVGRRRGTNKLLRSIDEIAGPAVVRSQFETLFRSVCQEAGLPAATTNHRVGRWELDAAWLELGVAVELDSYRWHGGRWAFHRDRRKGTDISRAGFELIRISWAQLKYQPEEVVEAVRHALARGEARLGSLERPLV